jgi:hypothetical protein
MILASARIDHQTKCQRHIGAAGEERYFLRYCIFDYVYIVLREIVHQSAARIAGYERHADQIHFDAYRLLPAADLAEKHQETKGRHGQQADARA